MKKSLVIILVLVVAASVVSMKLFRTPEVEGERLPPPVTEEEKKMAHEAHRLGTRLYAVAKSAQEQSPDEAVQQERLKPVYDQIQDFIFARLDTYSNSISSVVVLYKEPDIQCTIFVKPTPEEEMVKIRKAADLCVGRIIENLPIVRYLMIKQE